jgi:hypothetical protein
VDDMTKTAEQIVMGAVDAAGQAGGRDLVERMAAHGCDRLEFSPADQAVLVEEYGSIESALYEVQVEAQRRMTVES